MSKFINHSLGRADHDLERRINSYLVTLQVPALRRLRIEAHDGVITILGQVNTFYERQLAQHFVRRVAGVLSLVDKVVVESPKVTAPGKQSPPELLLTSTPIAPVVARQPADGHAKTTVEVQVVSHHAHRAAVAVAALVLVVTTTAWSLASAHNAESHQASVSHGSP